MSTISAGVTVPTALNLSGDTTGALTFQVSGTVTAATLSASGNLSLATGNLTFSSTGQRITGDFSNATVANRVMFQSSVTNASTQVNALPNGTQTVAGFTGYGSSDPTNTYTAQIQTFDAPPNNLVRFVSGITGTGTYAPMVWLTGGSERMRLDTSGNLGLGVTPTVNLDVKNGAGNCTISAQYGTGTKGQLIAASNEMQLKAFNGTNDVMTFVTGASERMRITSDGDVRIGTTADLGQGARLNIETASGEADVTTWRYNNAAAGKHWRWFIDSNSRLHCYNQGGVGVYINDGDTSWTGSSDERLKIDLKPIENSVNKVCQLRAVTGRFKTDEEAVSRSFLIAQDVQKVFPEAVSDINPDELGLRYTDMVPLLVAAVKELKAENDALKARIEALEAK